MSFRFERLGPEGGAVAALALLDAAGLREDPPAGRPRLGLNMVCTLDGRAAIDGSSRPLGGEGDLAMLLALRDSADAVLVGTGTLAAEGYARLVGTAERRAERVRRGMVEDPPLVLVSRSGEVPWDALVFEAASQPVLVYTEAPDVRVPASAAAPVEVVRLAQASPAAFLGDLAARGVRFLLSEGGPGLNGGLLHAGVVDELFLTLSLQITADSSQTGIVAGDPLPTPAHFREAWVLRGGEDLCLRLTSTRR